MVRCQYLEVPQVAETHAVIGSQPHWLWGLEHGVNTHRVAIGNETVFARESLPAIGLTGMDLVRLGLEREPEEGQLESVPPPTLRLQMAGVVPPLGFVLVVRAVIVREGELVPRQSWPERCLRGEC